MDLLGATRTVDLLGFAWFCTKGYGNVLVRSAGVATGQTHQCASKFDMGLYRAWVTACPPKTLSTRLGPGFFSLGVLRVATLHFHFFPDKEAMENACESAKNLSLDEAAQAAIQGEPNDVLPRTHAFVSG